MVLPLACIQLAKIPVQLASDQVRTLRILQHTPIRERKELLCSLVSAEAKIGLRQEQVRRYKLDRVFPMHLLYEGH